MNVFDFKVGDTITIDDNECWEIVRIISQKNELPNNFFFVLCKSSVDGFYSIVGLHKKINGEYLWHKAVRE